MPISSPTDRAASFPLSEPERARLIALLDALPSAAVLFGPAEGIVAVNRRGRELFPAMAGPGDAPEAACRWESRLRQMGPLADCIIAAVRDGQPLALHAVPLGSGGTIVDLQVSRVDDALWLASAVDVTMPERRRVALDRAEGELATLYDLTPSSVRLIAPDGTVRRRNDNAIREHAAPEPATVRELWERDAPRPVATGIPLAFSEFPAMRALAGEVVRGLLLDVRRHGGQRTIEVYAAPLRDGAGPPIGAVLLERDVLAAQEARARERRLAAIGQFATGVMHDLNNALNPIMAAAYLLRYHADSPDAVRDYADRITTAAEAGAATASRLGRFIRQEPMRDRGVEAMDLAVLATEVLDRTELGRWYGDGATGTLCVVRELAAGVRTRGLPDEVRDALRHLVENALDAMPSGGTLTIRTAVDGGDACIAVGDTGIGMAADVRDRAFEPFFTTKGTTASGLGLAEVYGIARRHHGSVQLSSERGRGTEVVLRFPGEEGASATAGRLRGAGPSRDPQPSTE